MTEFAKARQIVLRKTKPLAPPFHRHIARSRLIGRTCQVGDRVIVYKVISCEPPGPVQVQSDTILHFE